MTPLQRPHEPRNRPVRIIFARTKTNGRQTGLLPNQPQVMPGILGKQRKLLPQVIQFGFKLFNAVLVSHEIMSPLKLSFLGDVAGRAFPERDPHLTLARFAPRSQIMCCGPRAPQHQGSTA